MVVTGDSGEHSEPHPGKEIKQSLFGKASRV